MNKKYLLLDCNYLCHRAKHSMGSLSYEGAPTGVIYGFLKGLESYKDLFNTQQFIFCWDSKYSKRQELFPDYKYKRRNRKTELTEEEIIWENEFRKQMKKLRTDYLPIIGFKNIFCQKGYESDDIIASLCLNLNKTNDEGVIITSDKDLYQCVRSNISFYNPQKNKITTRLSFKKEYKIEPWNWKTIKVIAGCSTDEVPGAKGVGEKTAIKWFNGELSFESKAFKTIDDFIKTPKYKRNVKLIFLPFANTKTFKLKKDCLSKKGWEKVSKILGMKSIRNKLPFKIKKRKKK